MTEKQIKEMLNGIINNDDKWECRPIIEDEDDRPNWQPYKLGDKIHDDWEYRKVEVWCVYKQFSSYKIQEAYLTESWEKVFSGTKEECEVYLKEHTKKTWLETYLDEYCESNADRRHASFDIAYVCKKILEELKSYKVYGISSAVGDIINGLGIEVNSED